MPSFFERRAGLMTRNASCLTYSDVSFSRGVHIDVAVHDLHRIDLELHIALVAASCIARSRVESEEMPGADHFAFHHPSETKRPLHVRTLAVERHDRFFVD
ncbi:hypothetical protein D3C87_1344250 [compost metagenome]